MQPKTRFLHRCYLRHREWGALWAAPPAEAWRAMRGGRSGRSSASETGEPAWPGAS